MGTPVVELIYFDGCPHVERTREHLRSALDGGVWREWNLASAQTPERYRRFGSPTVLVNGRDVAGEAARGEAMSCRVGGPPSADLIRGALTRG